MLKFKYFKNGRWDVIFYTGIHALEFATELQTLLFQYHHTDYLLPDTEVQSG